MRRVRVVGVEEGGGAFLHSVDPAPTHEYECGNKSMDYMYTPPKTISVNKATIGKCISRRTEWCKFQLHITFQ